jgi:hypothetical protein
MPKEGNSFQIVLAPVMKKETTKKPPGKRKPLKETKANPIKKGKYERRAIKSTSLDNGFLHVNDLSYQTNVYGIRPKFIQDIGTNNQSLLQALSTTYAFNDNLSIIRTRFRKENARNCLKKYLSRLPFNQSQQFAGVIYKPGQTFLKYQNTINKSKTNELNKFPLRITEQAQDNTGFICEGCKRTDTRKYAKNLCQTCYKRKKKFIDGIEEQRTTIVPDTAPRINERPEPLPIPNKEWTGTCPDCKR